MSGAGEMQQVVLAQYCEGAPKPSDFRLESLPLPEPKEGQFRVAHAWCSVDPGTRSRLSGGDSYAAALPLGKPIDGFSVGTVDASANPDWPVGTKVFCAGETFGGRLIGRWKPFADKPWMANSC